MRIAGYKIDREKERGREIERRKERANECGKGLRAQGVVWCGKHQEQPRDCHILLHFFGFSFLSQM